MEQSTEIEIKEKSESLLSPASEHSLRTNTEQIQSVSESGDQSSIPICKNTSTLELPLPKSSSLQSPSEKNENSSSLEDSIVSQQGGGSFSHSSFSSYKLNTSYLDRFITSAVVSSELIRMRV